ncbi:MAG: helix-turn-helix transcriptional regulator [Quinella sp. 1Q7]|nr:helix-turn-helix transcriptional regulator [Quinella sp. 1Q7]
MRGACRFTAKDVAKLVAIFDLPAEYLMERDDGLPIMLSKRGETSYKNLSDEMEKRQLSYKELAKLIDLSSGSVSFKMCGKINFTARDIAKLVEIFDLPAEYLMMRDN